MNSTRDLPAGGGWGAEGDLDTGYNDWGRDVYQSGEDDWGVAEADLGW